MNISVELRLVAFTSLGAAGAINWVRRERDKKFGKDGGRGSCSLPQISVQYR